MVKSQEKVKKVKSTRPRFALGERIHTLTLLYLKSENF